MADSEPVAYVILAGNPGDGFNVWGPWIDWDDAITSLENDFAKNDAFIMPMYSEASLTDRVVPRIKPGMCISCGEVPVNVDEDTCTFCNT